MDKELQHNSPEMLDLIDRASKRALEKDIRKFFEEHAIDLKGKKVLDVGCGKGFHSVVMRDMGADVWVNSPNMRELKEAFSADKKMECRIEDIPRQHQGQFDVVTAFQALPDKGIYDFYNGIAKAMKPDAKAIIGFDVNIKLAINLEGIILSFKEKQCVHAYVDIDPEKEAGNFLKATNNYIYIVSDQRNISKFQKPF